MCKRVWTIVRVMICGVALCALTGCALHKKDLAATKKLSREETAFANGAGRAPSAATSYSFAKILIAQGRDSDALAVLARTVREYPKFIPAYNELAGIYSRSDRFADALSTLDAALKLAPRDAILRNNRGMCLLLKGDNAEALKSFKLATELAPTNPTYRANYALALGLAGRESEAANQYQTVMSDSDGRKNLAVLAKAREQLVNNTTR